MHVLVPTPPPLEKFLNKPHPLKKGLEFHFMVTFFSLFFLLTRQKSKILKILKANWRGGWLEAQTKFFGGATII